MPDPSDRTRSHRPDETRPPAADLTGAPTEGGGPVGPPLPDPVAAGRYVLTGEIARGGMGVVFRARDVELGRDVAVKVLGGQFAPDSPAAKRFLREAAIAGRLQHPGVAAVHQLGTLPDGRPFLAMKLIEGRTLADALAARPDPGHDRGHFLAVFEQICQTLAYAHALGIIHRDLKPSNVMVGNFGEVKVMDWGLAKVLRPPAPIDSGVFEPSPEPPPDPAWASTHAGTVLGTPAFMSPEQASGLSDRVDRRSDVFGLGAILCVVLTGRPPYPDADSAAARATAARGDLGECFARLDACGADPELVALCKQCLAPDPAGRAADAAAVAAAVAGVREGAEERARRAERDRETAVLRVAAEHERRRVQLELSAIALLLVGGLGAGAWLLERRGTDLRRQQAAEAERVRAGAEAALARLPELYRRALWDQADALVAQADRLVGTPGDPDLRARVDAARRDAATARELDRIRLDKATVIRGRLENGPALPRYEAAFREYGLDVLHADPAAQADRLNASAVRDQLIAALDDWGMTDPDLGHRRKIFALTAAATGQGWRTRVADAWADRAALAARYESIPPDQRTPGLTYEVAIRLGGSVRVLEEGLRRHPADFWLHFGLGVLGGPERAEARVGACRAARAIRPDVAAVYNNLSANLSARGDAAGAEWAAREAIRLDPGYVAAHTNLAAALLKKGDLPGSAAAYRAAIKLDPGDVLAHENLGRALLEVDDLAGAEAELGEAIRLLPRLGRAHAALGTVYRRQGRLADSVAAYRRAAELAPKDPNAGRQFRAAERLLALDKKLPALKAGTAKPDSPGEAAAAAELAAEPYRREYALAVRLYAAAFAADPKLAEPPGSHRYNAACAAARLAAGDDPTDRPDAEARAAARARALGWLTADLGEVRKLADPRPAADFAAHWLRDADLAAVRDAEPLAALPADERKRWEAFWDEVRAVRDGPAKK